MAMIHIAISPGNRNACENSTFEIASKLGNDWHVWMNKRLTFQINGSSVDREVDAMLYHKEHGLLLLECKDGKLSCNPGKTADDIRWYQNGRPMDRPPTEQAHSLTHPVHDYLKAELRDPLWNLPRRVRIQWALCLCHMDTPEGIPASIVPPERMIFKCELNDVQTFEKKIIRILNTKEVSCGNRPFANDPLEEPWLEKFFAFLDGKDRLSWSDQWKIQENARKKPTELQKMLMESVARNPRIRIEGVAGSGKTLLLEEEALRFARAGKRVAIVCYNELLARAIKKDIGIAGVSPKTAEVHEFFGWAAKCARDAKIPFTRPKDKESKAKFYGEEGCALFKKALKATRRKELFDALFIDEGQDLENGWVDTALNLLKEPATGIVRFFYDPEQKLYSDSGDQGREFRMVLGNETVNAMPILVLSKGFRSTKNILAWVRENTGKSVSCYDDTPEGGKVEERFYKDPAEQKELLIKEIERLRKKKVEPRDICVVSMTSKKHSALADMDGDTFSWCVTENKELSESKVNIVSVYRFKGLDRKVVIVTDMDPLPGDIHRRASEETKRFVAATRAKERLIVLRRK